VPAKRTRNKKLLSPQGARQQPANVDLELPIGLLTCVTGVSGSGKSTLINNTLFPGATALNGATTLEPRRTAASMACSTWTRWSISTRARSAARRAQPGDLHRLFTPIRELFAGVPEARSRGYGPGRFSFNVKGGRCEAARATA
jgi:excinuclease ABC subunit A